VRLPGNGSIPLAPPPCAKQCNGISRQSSRHSCITSPSIS
jgi:hypothetical protein